MITQNEYNLLKRIKDNGKELPETEMTNKEKRILKKLEKKGLVAIREYKVKEVSNPVSIDVHGIWETPNEALPLDKESSLHILSGLVRQLELGFMVPDEKWQQAAPDYCKSFKENIAPIYRAAINVLAGLDQSASWIETAGFPKKDDSQSGCT